MPKKKEKKRQIRAETIMGEGAYAQQVRSKRRAKMKGAKASTVATIKRVGEYQSRAGKLKTAIKNATGKRRKK
jgi:hypothetical protein